VRRIVTSLGGTLAVESCPNYGAFFEVFLPAVRAAGEVAA